jgi:uncharacterized protein YciI
MRFVIHCILASNTNEMRIALRAEHLQYIEANKERIFCGGPTIDANGHPEMMLIIVNATDLASAEAFINMEPYNRAGLFARVTVREWIQVLPESQPGALLSEISSILKK